MESWRVNTDTQALCREPVPVTWEKPGGRGLLARIMLDEYEPRAIKGTGVTYATTPQGADHTNGLTIRAKIDHLGPKGQVANSLNAQLINAGYDSLGACLFSDLGFSTDPTLVSELVRTVYGWGVPDYYLQVLGKETNKLEREWNRRAGFTNAHDRLLEWMTRKPVAPTNAVFEVPNEEPDTIFDKLD